MKLHNPSGRHLRLELSDATGTTLPIVVGPQTTLDLDRYQRALEALRWAAQDEAADPEAEGAQ